MGLWRVARSAPQRQAGVWVNVGLFVLLASLVGARLFYVFVNRTYFTNHLSEMPEIWLGGLSWPGAIAGAWLAVGFLALVYRSPHGERATLGAFGDRLYPILPPLAITTWIGCWHSGVAYGLIVPENTWWGVRSLDEANVYHSHLPLQPLAALVLLVFFWVLETQVKPFRPAGRLSGLAVLGLLLNLLGASLLRADPTPYWNGLPMDTWMAIAYLVFFLTFVLLNNLVPRIWRNNPTPAPEER